MRARMSVVPPGANGTTMVTGFWPVVLRQRAQGQGGGSRPASRLRRVMRIGVILCPFLSAMVGRQTRSRITAMPWPTPMHMVHSAYLPPSVCSWLTAVVASARPMHPAGGPRRWRRPTG